MGILVSMGGFTRYLEWMLIGGPMPCVTAGVAAVDAFDAIIIVEMLRMAVPRFESWSDRKHFRVVGILWAVLFLMAMAGALIVRAHAQGDSA